MYYQGRFNYTGSEQLFITPVSGWYRIELYGAKGGDDLHPGGYGVSVTGEMHFSAGEQIYVYVGAPGTSLCTGTGAGYNGGGNTGVTGASGGGGGATDIRLKGGAWNDSTGMKTRIMVAAGGGGGGLYSNGGIGGALVGGNGTGATGGTQTNGGSYAAGFGTGGATVQDGGGGAAYSDNGAAGGSSYIAGFEGCSTVYASLTEGHPVRDAQMDAGVNAGPCYALFILVERDAE